MHRSVVNIGRAKVPLAQTNSNYRGALSTVVAIPTMVLTLLYNFICKLEMYDKSFTKKLCKFKQDVAFLLPEKMSVECTNLPTNEKIKLTSKNKQNDPYADRKKFCLPKKSCSASTRAHVKETVRTFWYGR